MTEAEYEDVWEQAGENAINSLTYPHTGNDPDFDEFYVATNVNVTANVNNPDHGKVLRDKYEFTPLVTLNVLSPATPRRSDKTFVKAINTPMSEKVINSVEHMNLESNISNQKLNKEIPDKINCLTLNDIFGDSSVRSDLNSLCNASIVSDFNITVSQRTSLAESDAPPHSIAGHNVTSQWDGLEREISSSLPMLLSTPLFFYQDAVQHVKSINLRVYEPDVMTSIHLTGLAKFFAQLSGPPRLKAALKSEKTFIFCLARCQFDNDDPKDFQLLMTIYKSLTGTTLDCARYGSHWQDIGFQGNDPATDLRGTGMLSLLTILYLVQEQTSLAQKLYQLSQHEVHNFPFCVLLINITQTAIVALRSGYLNKECNNRLAVLPIMCDFFSALVYEYDSIWKTDKTIGDSGFVLKRLDEKTKSSSLCTELMSNYKKYCNEKEGVFERSDIVFVNVCETDGNNLTIANYGTSHKKNKLICKYGTS